MKRAVVWLLSLAALVAALGLFAVTQLRGYLHAPLAVPADGLLVNIQPGTPFSKVCRELAATGAIEHPAVLRLYARITGDAQAVQAGEYRLEKGTTAESMLAKFKAGQVVLYSFTIVEGWNRYELLAAMHANAQIVATLSESDLPALLDELGASESNPEGQFLPETYRFPNGTTDKTLLSQAYQLMQQVLVDEWPTREPGLPLASPYAALILASIVEKETAREDERARIAGVFVRRLQKGMRLQTDPTVIYGIGPGFDGNLTKRDLQTDTVYNTYTRAGLPPTPIAMPGRAAIQAALHPADGRELYFVASGLGDGSHRFSETSAQHQAAVAEYLRNLRRRSQ